MTPRTFTRGIGIAAVALGALILVRDLIQVRSIPYAVAGVGLVAFGAWRLQVAARMRG